MIITDTSLHVSWVSCSILNLAAMERDCAGSGRAPLANMSGYKIFETCGNVLRAHVL